MCMVSGRNAAGCRRWLHIPISLTTQSGYRNNGTGGCAQRYVSLWLSSIGCLHPLCHRNPGLRSSSVGNGRQIRALRYVIR